MSEKQKHYCEMVKLTLLREYYSSGMSKISFVKKHDLRFIYFK